MAPEATPARFLRAVSPKLLVAPAARLNSRLIERVAVDPPILIVPSVASVIYYSCAQGSGVSNGTVVGGFIFLSSVD